MTFVLQGHILFYFLCTCYWYHIKHLNSTYHGSHFGFGSHLGFAVGFKYLIMMGQFILLDTRYHIGHWNSD
jgi:hypothetical protein